MNKNPRDKIPPHVKALQAKVDVVEDQLQEGIEKLEEQEPKDLVALLKEKYGRKSCLSQYQQQNTLL